LPDGADRSKALVVLQPQTGRMLVEVAPWVGHEGVCYVVLQKRAGCLRRHGQTIAMWPPPVVFTFDARVVSADRGRVYRFPTLGVAIALPPAGVRRVALLDRLRTPIVLVRLSG
jgi:hypothetical protein